MYNNLMQPHIKYSVHMQPHQTCCDLNLGPQLILMLKRFYVLRPLDMPKTFQLRLDVI